MEAWLAQVPLWLLVASRVTGVTITAPIFASRYVPPQVRVALSFILALLLLPAVQGHVSDTALTTSGFVGALVLELLVGLVIGFLSQLTFAVLQVAGALADLELGFLNAQIYDPVTGRSDSLTSTFLFTLGLTVYLLLDGHHWLLRALADSYLAVPAGGLIPSEAGPLYVVNLFGVLLATSVQMVLPFIAVMLLVSLALAGMSRAVPQLHVFAVGMGAKTVAGLAFLAILIPYLLGVLEPHFANMHRELLHTLELLHRP
jgi:flagellar biosynthetic protein FliR